jgi:putative transposase
MGLQESRILFCHHLHQESCVVFWPRGTWGYGSCAGGEIAVQCWQEIPHHHAGIKLDEFVIMPDHMHGIVVICNPVVVVETVHAPSLLQQRGKPTMSEISPKAGSLGAIIRSYKSAVTRLAGLAGFKEFAWQTRYYDHIVRDENSLCNIRQYVIDNPARWELDRENSPGLYM